MDSLRRIEDDVRNLGIEAKKKYPAIKEATEKSFQTLKNMRDSYVAEVMRKDSNYINKFRSPDITAPYYMVCSQSDAPPKLLTMALGGIQLFLDLDSIPPNEAAQIMRIFNIQVATGKAEIQLKVLQMTLQFANLLAQDKVSSQYLTDSIVKDMLYIPLQLCDGKSSVIVLHTALATASQILGLIMNGVCDILDYYPTSIHNGSFDVNSDQASSSLVLSAQLMVRDLAMLTTGRPGQWMKGLIMNQTNALDLLNDVLVGWQHLFKYVPLFVNVVKGFICQSINKLLKRVQSDYSSSVNGGGSSASIFVLRVVRTARFLLHNFLQIELLDEIELMVSLMVQCFQAADLDDSLTNPNEGRPNVMEKLLSRLNIPVTTAHLLKQPIIHNTLSNFSLQNTARTVSSDSFPAANMLMLSSLTSGTVITVHAHPAGVCLEAVLSFLLSNDIIDNFLSLEGGSTALANVCIVCLASCSIAISEAFSVEGVALDFEIFIKDNIQIPIIEGILSGEEADSDHAVRQLYEHLLSSGTISSNEVLLLSFQIMQVIIRLLTQCAVKVALLSKSHLAQEQTCRCFLSPELLPPTLMAMAKNNHPFLCRAEHEVGLRAALIRVCEHCHEAIISACVTLLLSGIENSRVIRRSLGIIAETAFIAGLLGLGRICDTALSTLCKFTIPQWGHEDKGSQVPSSPHKPDKLPDTFEDTISALRWRHVQAFVRLVQVVHCLADVIGDWDVIMDCFEQLSSYILNSNSTSRRVEVTPDELEKIIDCIGRFKLYTVHIADGSLVKLMASLVALSLNSLAVLPSGQSTATNSKAGNGSNTHISSSSLAAVMSMGVSGGKGNSTQYLTEGISKGLIGFSMQATIEISKMNSFRVSSIWQMVMSHLRMVASLKSSTLRVVSVAATHDVIAATLEFLLSHEVALSAEDELHPFMMTTARMTDDILYSLVMPQFETAFDALRYQRAELSDRLQHCSDWPKLTQLDLFSSLKSLSSVRYDDVRKGVLFGLRSLLQGRGGGQIQGVGWVTIIELLILVPSSMKSELEDVDADEDDTFGNREQWPRATLETAFACMTLIVDDFLDVLPDYAILQGICCLASFGAQILDVNISLTAVELLWKVTDHALSSGVEVMCTEEGGQGATVSKIDLLNLTMMHLQTLAKDPRPEIRNCAMRTLFAAIVANSHLLSVDSWKFVFNDVLFPLFGATVDKSSKASNEQSDAPEIKKGVKMTVHHSRDTASKQWAETISLEVKGFARIMKACTKLLLEEGWFFGTWTACIDICINAARTPSIMNYGSTGDSPDRSAEEVSLAGLDSLISLLKTASPASLMQISGQRKSDSDKLPMRLNKIKDMLWQSAWKAVGDLAAFDQFYFDEYALKFLVMLLDYFNTENALLEMSVFSHSNVSVIRTFLDTVVLLTRPRRKSSAMSKPSELQTIRNVMLVLKSVMPTSLSSYIHLVSALTEIAFAVTPCIVKCPFRKVDIILDPVHASLRLDVGKYLTAITDFQSLTEEDAAVIKVRRHVADHLTGLPDEVEAWELLQLVCLDIVSRRFVIDICETAISRRSSSNALMLFQSPVPSIGIIRKPSLTVRQRSQNYVGGFFSAVGSLLVSHDAFEDSEVSIGARELEVIGRPLRRLEPFTLQSRTSLSGVWGIFPAGVQELEVLVASLRCVVEAYSNVDFNMRPLVWSSLVASLMCISSPWDEFEVSGHVADGCELPEEQLQRLSELLQTAVNMLVAYALADKFPSRAVQVLSDGMQATARLVVSKLGHLALESHTRAQLASLAALHGGIVAISQATTLPVTSRRRALVGALSVLQDLSDALFTCPSPSTREHLRRGCEGCLIRIRDIRCTLEALPAPGEMDPPVESVETQTAAWVMCCADAASIAADSWDVDSVKSLVKSSNLMVVPNGHLLLLIPLFLRILQAESGGGIVDAALRDTTASLLSALDSVSVVGALRTLEARLSKLELAQELRNELNYI